MPKNSNISLIFPHQLFADASLWQNTCYLIEEHLFFKLYPFHKQKLVLHRASMKAYEQKIINAGKKVIYIDATHENSDCRNLINSFDDSIKKVHFIDVVDDWLRDRLKKALLQKNIEIKTNVSPLFLNPVSVY